MQFSAFTEMKGKFNLENVAKEIQYTNDMMGLCRNQTYIATGKNLKVTKPYKKKTLKTH